MLRSLPTYLASLLVAMASCGNEVALPSGALKTSPSPKTAIEEPVLLQTSKLNATKTADSPQRITPQRIAVVPDPAAKPNSPNQDDLDWDESDLDWEDIDFLEESAAAASTNRGLRALERRQRRTNRSTRSRIDQKSLKPSAAKRLDRTKAATLAQRSRAAQGKQQ